MSKTKQASTPPSTPSVVDESSLAWKIFDAFVSDGQISVTEDELKCYAANELKLQMDKMPESLNEHLPMILVAFMNMWSGWHFKGEFLAGKFQKEHYFQRFHKFMVHKMNCTVRGQYAAALKSLKEPLLENKSDPEFSPYAISIQCPPHLLNTIVFSNLGDDVIMKQHLGSTWQDLSTTQLLNWPHVEVSFRTQDICFVRRQATDFVRYLNFLPHESNKNNESIIEHVETLRTYGRQKHCYSHNYLEEYMKVYVQILKTLDQISTTKFDEIQTILTQFLEDVKYIDVNKSMATNTVVLFRLSPVAFIRNKKLMKTPEKETDEARVGYCEIITPKIELVMLYFRAEQKDTPELSFEYTDTLKNSEESASVVLPYIAYKCTFCRVEYTCADSKKLMLNHLKNDHKMEQHVRCTLCKKQFDVLNLAACRWRHKCQPGPQASNTAKVSKHINVQSE